jgi:hypothetical protein
LSLILDHSLLGLDREYFKAITKDCKVKIVKIISNDLDLLVICVKKYMSRAMLNEDILLSSSKMKKDEIENIKSMLLQKEKIFKNEILELKKLLNVFIK